ncbi:hypothetical protein QYE76_004708 [Lolium multiflorum]|uniref:F-box domain-containing protein n=1 Tax=Lolium multiflorum TaxID=4521 RepID=A0AAD8RSC4_LOLMU|nr:hypothetical protein QYE76_004593 [Lolium multiflorum]KAK1630393.1 hypothetical protein QYE76_004708 [Lolium multiflorum]
MAPPEDEGDVPAAALRVPEHVIARVFSQLDCVDLLSCSLVCRQWFSDSAELRDEWRKEYLEAWNLQGLSFKTWPQSPCPTCSIRSLQTWCP